MGRCGQRGREYAEAGIGLPARTVTGTVELIAHLFRVTKESLDDVVGLASEINSMGIGGLQQLVEYKLLYGDGSSSTIDGLLHKAGVQAYTQAATGAVGRFSAVRHLVTMLENVGAIGTGLIVNPNDRETFDTSVGLDDHWMLPAGHGRGFQPRARPLSPLAGSLPARC